MSAFVPLFICTRYSYRPFYDSKQNDPEAYQGDSWFDEWSWETQGRLFGLELEAKLLGTDVKDIKKTLEQIQDPYEAIDLINKLLHAKGEKILESDAKEIFFEQLKETSLPNINQMSSKRLKDIYINNEPIEEILKFIPMLESVLDN